MKSYPSITKQITGTNVIAFDKLDGSNIRAEWSKKRGFYKFGTRTKMLNKHHPHFGEAIPLILEKQEQLVEIFLKQSWEKVVVFFEYYGDNSFAGAHEDEHHVVTLIDVNVHKRGMIEPNKFIELFSKVGIPKVLFNGVVTNEFITNVRNGTLEGMTFEGVICKFVNNGKQQMFKIKNVGWLHALKYKCNGDEKMYKHLS